MRIRAVLVSVVLFLFTNSMVHANLVASTPGEFSVSSTGAATYSVPIVVPPGTAGVEPKLSLNYSSQGRNGLLGVGWSIGGLSVIHRCPANLVKDGFIDGIDFDDNDRFCLDGQPLIAINGTYGANNTEYRTEINNFSKIISYGSTGNGPEMFKVWTKSGEIMEYGYTTDSRINPPLADGTTQSDALCWLLNKVTDTVGNFMTVTYFEDTSTGENYPQQIDYTGNTGLTPYNSVEFTYEARTDSGTRYLAGLKMESTKRLKTITSKEGANKVREYKLTYIETTETNQSQISSFQECDGSANCIAATNLTTPHEADGTTTQAFLQQGSSQGPVWRDGNGHDSFLGEFNGDGRTDVVQIARDNYNAQTLFTNTNGSFTQAFHDTTSLIWRTGDTGYGTFPGDFNGDGLTDLLQLQRSNYYGQTLLADGNGSFTQAHLQNNYPNDGYFWDGGPVNNTGTDTYMGDFNGDGLTDAVQIQRDYYQSQTLLSNGDGTFSRAHLQDNYPTNGTIWRTGTATDAYTGDFNGDGLTDILQVMEGYYQAQTLLSNGDGTFTQAHLQDNYPNDGVIWRVGSASEIFTADFNGDGLTDILQIMKDYYLAQTLLSNGDGTFTRAHYQDNYPNDGVVYRVGSGYTTHLGDFNGDGMSDILQLHRTLYEGQTLFSNGDGTFTRAHLQSNYPNDGNYWDGGPENNTGTDTFVGEFSGDGLSDVLQIQREYYYAQTLFSNGNQFELASAIINGLGVDIEIDYTPITNNTIYTKGSGASFPEIDLQAPMYVVSESRTNNGLGSNEFNTLTYEYEGAKVHVQGRGLLGFSKRTVTDVDTNIVIETNYKQAFPYIGQVESTKTTVDGTLVSEESNTFAALGNTTTGPAFPYVDPAVSKTYDVNGGALLTTVTTDSTYDSYGNPTNITVTTADVGIDTYTTTTLNTYTNDTTKWHLGRLTQAVVSKTGGAQTSPSRTSTFEYDSTNGLLTKETIEPGGSFELVKTYTHDGFGNRISVTESGSGITSRTTTTSYDSKGQFPTTVTNALGHSESREYNDPYGNVTKLTGPNLLDTTWEYDSLGRKSREMRADGTETNMTYAFCNGSCPSQVSSLASYKITTTTTGAATSIAYYDAVNRVILTETQSFDGTSVYVETEYDAQGRVDRRSNPYFGTSTTYWTDYSYDDLGRVIQEDSPTTGLTTMTYSGFITTVTVHRDQGGTITQLDNKEQTNSLGQTLWTEDDNNNQLTFAYDAQGNLITVTDSEGNITSNTYNLRGFKTTMSDPDMGDWKYEYNVLGELTAQWDAKTSHTGPATVTMSYDKLGRLISRTENEGTTTWTYDTATKGKGKLASVSHYGGYSRSHTYDSVGRPSSTTTVIGGSSYTATTTYDPSGRVDDVSYPGSSNFKVDHVYNIHGYLEKVRNANNTSEVFYTALAADQFGNITSQTLGSGAAAITTFRSYQQNSGRIQHIDSVVQDLEYTFDSIGNLTQRKDHDQSALTEDFTYDNLNRLKKADVLTVGYVDFTYDDLGNITNKSDVGNYTYGAGNAGPHAVTSAGGNTYTYDNNGNQITGDGKTITWSSFNKPTQITKGSSTSSFTYGPDRARYLQVTTESSTTTTTTYIGGLYEKVEKTGQATQEKHFIRAGNQTIAIFTDRSSGTDTTEYLHRDHLGSIDTITDANGAIVEKLSFDAFGKRRLSNWNSGVPSIVSNNTRGYTGHEMLDAVGLIHMNGRVYDPLLGRFMSADPTMQFPKNMQNYNRYSYVLNNPLSYTDPSGFFLKSIKKAFKKLVKGIKKVFKKIAQNELLSALVTIGVGFGVFTLASKFIASKVIAGAIGGFAGGFVGSGGDIRAGVIGGLSGAALGAIGAKFGKPQLFSPKHFIKIGLHGLVGGAASAAQGGKFGRGFLSAGVTQAFAPGIDNIDSDNLGISLERTLVAAVVGGTTSELTGGKFANGAVTGSFSRLLNDEYTKQLAEDLKQKIDVLLKMSNKELKVALGVTASDLPIVKHQLGVIYGAANGQQYIDTIIEFEKDLIELGIRAPITKGAKKWWNIFSIHEPEYDFSGFKINCNGINCGILHEPTGKFTPACRSQNANGFASC